jgi:8-oxo-dGTP diphosphatase
MDGKDLDGICLTSCLTYLPNSSDENTIASRKMTEYKFCPRCGHSLELKEAEEHHIRPVCPACGLIVYLNPPLAAGVVAVNAHGEIVLVLRGENPGKGMWGLPAGFMEVNETVEQAARRECLEETGLEVEIDNLLGVWSYYHDVKQSSGVVVLYAARIINGTAQAGSDSVDVKFFLPEKIPQSALAFHTHLEAIARWQEQKKTGAMR